ncbi:response regulator transcription factor [Opitutus sp. GAS368]|uniref:response regulator n=1 Tax=Opitutus sp. GAS368 TaxID=1882749 RepID=UPI00087CC1B8|nr:response regulator transcription factor [Opitutus sp. GAS368]SDR81768.1 two component transcriptional regulator, LuxR family [Opitutus sp. GAS368]
MSLRNLKVLICDDHALIREGLKRILLDTGKADHVGEVTTAEEAVAAVRREAWDIVILDINLGRRSGLDVLKEIKAEFPRLPILILSVYPEEQFALRVIRAGANGYLNKNLATKVLIEAIRQVLAGGQYLSPKVAEQLVNAVKQPAGQPLHAALSDREDEVLRLIAIGRTVGEIARQLDLSVKTVSTYRSIVLRKLGMENNAQLMRYAQEHKLGGW